MVLNPTGRRRQAPLAFIWSKPGPRVPDSFPGGWEGEEEKLGGAEAVQGCWQAAVLAPHLPALRQPQVHQKGPDEQLPAQLRGVHPGAPLQDLGSGLWWVVLPPTAPGRSSWGWALGGGWWVWSCPIPQWDLYRVGLEVQSNRYFLQMQHHICSE